MYFKMNYLTHTNNNINRENTGNQIIEKVTLPVVGPLHSEALSFDGTLIGKRIFGNLKPLYAKISRHRK